VLPAREQVRQEHQQREHADALGDHAQPRGETAQPIRAPVWSEQEVAQQPVVRECQEEADRRIYLRTLGLIDELERAQQRRGRVHADAVIPQPPAEVVDQRDHAQSGQQRRQQEGDAPAASHGVEKSLYRHEQRRLVRIQLAAAMRDQPVAGFDHLLGDQGEARFVRRPGIAQAEPSAEHDERDAEQ